MLKRISISWGVFAFMALGASAHAVTNESIHVTAGPGMIFVNPYGAGFQVNAGIGARVNQTATSALFVGADLGLGFLGDLSGFSLDSGNNITSTSVDHTGATVVQLLPTIYYRTQLSETVRQYFGASIGPAIFIQDIPATAATSTSSTKVFLEILLRPGIELAVSHQVSFLFEPKFGIVRSSFIFLPQANCMVLF